MTSPTELSRTEPELQNIPIRTETGNSIRKAFYPPQGYCKIDVDFTSIEMRIMAEYFMQQEDNNGL